MADPEVTAHHRVIAFDLPWHGRSSPPDGWWDEEYLLTTDRYVDTIMAVIDALDLDAPVVLGCSGARWPALWSWNWRGDTPTA
jgi:pimeloyl-ACP methyl ester carboxylesterase